MDRKRPASAGLFLCRTTLDELWSADEQAAAELRPLVAPLAKLARELELRENESAQVAPFIYAMF
jgi:hypothetical protein